MIDIVIAGRNLCYLRDDGVVIGRIEFRDAHWYATLDGSDTTIDVTENFHRTTLERAAAIVAELGYTS